MKKLLTILFLLVATGALSQDIHLSQFTSTPLMRNPALAGIFTGNIRVNMAHRDQWGWAGFPYRTTALSAEYKFSIGESEDYLTAGVQAFHDDAGTMHLTTTQVMPALNYHKLISSEHNRYISAGFMVGFAQRKFDMNNLTFGSQYTNGSYSPANPSGETMWLQNRTFLDAAVGLSYNSNFGEYGNWYVGASAYHINRPKQNFSEQEIQLDPKFQFNAGLHHTVSEQWDFYAEANALSQGSYREYILGGMITTDLRYMVEAVDERNQRVSAGIGLYYRYNDAFVPVAKFIYENIEAGFSYDVNTSRLKAASRGKGAFELTISYRGFFGERGGMMQQSRCPAF